MCILVFQYRIYFLFKNLPKSFDFEFFCSLMREFALAPEHSESIVERFVYSFSSKNSLESGL